MSSTSDSRSISFVGDEDGGVLLDSDRGICFSLNPVGAIVWQALSDGSNREQIIALLRDKFDEADDEQLALDVDDFLGELKAKGLL